MQQSVLVSRRAAIATPHHLATEAGAEAYRKGGSAVDAAIAAAAVLTVVYPHNTGIGGDSVSLVRQPDGETACVNATGFAAEAASLEALREKHGTRLPIRGADVITVPGAVRGWERLFTLGARLAWSDLLAPAASLAADGFPVSRSLADAIALARDDLVQDRGSAGTFLQAGRPLVAGQTLTQPRLADSLRALQTGGADELYIGALGQTLRAGLRRLGSVLDASDFADFSVEMSQPLSGDFRGTTVLTSPPNTQGFLLLRFLSEIEGLGDGVDVLGVDAGRLAEMFEEGGRVRDALLCDPAFGDVDLDVLLHGHIESILGAGLGGVPRGDTVGIAAVDSDGFAISHVQSHFFHFGSTVLEPETGILLHNRGTSFSLDAASANRIEPRKRPSHSLMPVMVERDGVLSWVNACMGGMAQSQVQAQLVLRQLAGRTSAQTVGEPRFVVGSYSATEPEDLLHIEQGMPTAAADSLARTDLPKITAPRFHENFGQANVVAVLPEGGFDVASDPRSDGAAVVVDLP